MDDTPAPGWLCARRSRAGSSLRTAAPRCWVYCVVATSRVSPVYRSSARSPPRPACVFPGRATEAVEAAHVSVHPPNLKEDGKSPQSCPSPDLQENPCYCNNPPPLTISSTPVCEPQPLFRFFADLLPRRLPLHSLWPRRGLGGARIRFCATMRTLPSAAILRGQGVERGGGLLSAGLHLNNSCLTVCPT